MTKVRKHVIIPVIVPLIFFAVVAMPVEILGCRNRGLVAVLVAYVGGPAGVGAALKALQGRVRNAPDSRRWVATALILAIPAIYIVAIAF